MVYYRLIYYLHIVDNNINRGRLIDEWRWWWRCCSYSYSMMMADYGVAVGAADEQEQKEREEEPSRNERCLYEERKGT